LTARFIDVHADEGCFSKNFITFIPEYDDADAVVCRNFSDGQTVPVTVCDEIWK
jgi:hypothetical protein